MSSYRQLVYHLVFRTKRNIPSIRQEYSNQLYAYISGIIKKKDSHLYRINGVADHIHILTDIHPSVALADFVKDIKVSSSLWMKGSNYFPDFIGWSEGYGAFTCNYYGIEKIIEYIINQQEHHLVNSFEKEYRRLIQEAGLTIDEGYFP
jgi:putative transposase